MLKFLLAFLATGFISLGSYAHQNINPISGKKKAVLMKKKVVSRSKKSSKKVVVKRSSKKSSKKIKQEPVALDEFSRNKGSFISPIEDGNIKTGFGPYRVGLGNVEGNNPGLTIESSQGSAVKSIFNGVVTLLFNIEGTLGVIVRHGAYLSVYSNLSSVNVAINDKINSGDIIGNAASNKDGNAELEFLLMKKNKNIDPAPWIKKSK